MNDKILISCPNCEINGRKNYLGELFNDGSFGVLRFHKAITRIVSKDYTIICDLCNEPAFSRKEEVESLSDGITRISRQSLSVQIGTFGTSGLTR